MSASDASKSRYIFSVSPRLLPTERTTLVGVRQVCRRNGIRKTPADDSHADRTLDNEDDEVSWTWQETDVQSLRETDTFEVSLELGDALCIRSKLTVCAIDPSDGRTPVPSSPACCLLCTFAPALSFPPPL